MKVIRTTKSIGSKESRLYEELKSTEVTNYKMPDIRFVVSLIVIQMRQNKVSSIPGKGEMGEWKSTHQTTPAPHRWE
jgi:hypothetical protein